MKAKKCGQRNIIVFLAPVIRKLKKKNFILLGATASTVHQKKNV
jgi:hypothetical protein